MSKYSMGIDFGTLSARAVIVDIETGEEKATSVSKYAHGVMSKELLGVPLPADYALQHPKDYLDSLFFVIKECIKNSGVDSADITGIGVDFTASTVLPVTSDGTPLCFLDNYKKEPHAYVKLWKHHAAQKEADEINALAKETGAPWLSRYGGIISSECSRKYCRYCGKMRIYIIERSDLLKREIGSFGSLREKKHTPFAQRVLKQYGVRKTDIRIESF